MLNPEYLKHITDRLECYWYDVETLILEDIAERVMLNQKHMTSTAEYQLAVAESLGVSNDRVNSYLAKALKVSVEEAERIINDSTYKSLEYDDVIYDAAFKKGLIDRIDYDHENIKNIISNSISLCSNDLSNICKTTAQTSQSLLLQSLNSAFLQISSGAFSSDIVVKNTVEELAKSGLDWIDYASGTHRRLDTVVRTTIRTASNQAALKCQEQVMDEFDVNLVETTSHLGARPSHAGWQGQIYWRKKEVKGYRNFEEATGYGTITGLGGINCRHSFYPYFEGISEQTFQIHNLKENEELYNLEQQQRYNERHIREWERRAKVKKAAGLDNSKEKSKVKEWKQRNDALIKSDDRLKHNYARERTYFSKNSFLSVPEIKISKFGEEKTLKKYTSDEIISFAKANEKIIDKHISKASKWSGKIVVDDQAEKYGKLWSCDIVTSSETSPMIILREQLHARSVSYYDWKVYNQFKKIEESSVQFLTQEISNIEGIEIIESVYDDLVDSLRKLNKLAFLYENDYEFALNLFNMDLPDRLDWLETKVYDNLRTNGNIEELMAFNELIKKFY